MFPTAATAASTSPVMTDETARWRASPTCPAAAALRKQALKGAVDPGKASVIARANAACASRSPIASSNASAPTRKSSPEGVSPGPSPTKPRTASSQSHGRSMSGVKQLGQPAFESRDARAGDARQRRLTPRVSGTPKTRRARPSCGASIAARRANELQVSISRVGGGQMGQAGARHGSALIQREAEQNCRS